MAVGVILRVFAMLRAAGRISNIFDGHDIAVLRFLAERRYIQRSGADQHSISLAWPLFPIGLVDSTMASHNMQHDAIADPR